MKAKIKSTGDIFPIAPYAKVTLNVCDDRGTPYEVDFEDIELMPDNILESDVDWSSFRREAAKDFVCALLQDNRISYSQPYEWFCKEAIELANELIKQLREQ